VEVGLGDDYTCKVRAPNLLDVTEFARQPDH
jgi:hypothetical protein